MPLRTPDDHAASDQSRNYCRHCARTDGSMKDYNEVLAGMTQFLIHTQGLDPGVAEATAKQTMTTLPAWQGKARA